MEMLIPLMCFLEAIVCVLWAQACICHGTVLLAATPESGGVRHYFYLLQCDSISVTGKLHFRGQSPRT